MDLVDLGLLFWQGVVFKEGHYGVHPTGPRPDLVDPEGMTIWLGWPEQVLDEDDLRKVLSRGSRECSQ